MITRKTSYPELVLFQRCLQLLAAEKLPLITEINRNLSNIEEIFEKINKEVEKIRETFYEVDLDEAKEKQNDKTRNAKEKVTPSFKKFVFEQTDPKRNPTVVRDENGKPVPYKVDVKLKPNQRALPMVPDDKMEDFQFEINKLFNESSQYDLKIHEILEDELDRYTKIKFERSGVAFDSQIIKPIQGIIIVKEYSE